MYLTLCLVIMINKHRINVKLLMEYLARLLFCFAANHYFVNSIIIKGLLIMLRYCLSWDTFVWIICFVVLQVFKLVQLRCIFVIIPHYFSVHF